MESFLGAFYSVHQDHNRDLTIAIICEYVKSFFDDELMILDAFTGIGVRAIRYALNLLPIIKAKGHHRILVSGIDSDEKCIELCKKNVENSLIPNNNIQFIHGDVLSFLNLNESKRKYNIIELDPFGNCLPYIASATVALRDNGLLCLTFTDAKILFGGDNNNTNNSFFSVYGISKPKFVGHREFAMRAVLSVVNRELHNMARIAAPMACWAFTHGCRLIIRVQNISLPTHISSAMQDIAKCNRVEEDFSSAVEDLPEVSMSSSFVCEYPGGVVTICSKDQYFPLCDLVDTSRQAENGMGMGVISGPLWAASTCDESLLVATIRSIEMSPSVFYMSCVVWPVACGVELDTADHEPLLHTLRMLLREQRLTSTSLVGGENAEDLVSPSAAIEGTHSVDAVDVKRKCASLIAPNTRATPLKSSLQGNWVVVDLVKAFQRLQRRHLNNRPVAATTNLHKNTSSTHSGRGNDAFCVSSETICCRLDALGYFATTLHADDRHIKTNAPVQAVLDTLKYSRGCSLSSARATLASRGPPQTNLALGGALGSRPAHVDHSGEVCLPREELINKAMDDNPYLTVPMEASVGNTPCKYWKHLRLPDVKGFSISSESLSNTSMNSKRRRTERSHCGGRFDRTAAYWSSGEVFRKLRRCFSQVSTKLSTTFEERKCKIDAGNFPRIDSHTYSGPCDWSNPAGPDNTDWTANEGNVSIDSVDASCPNQGRRIYLNIVSLPNDIDESNGRCGIHHGCKSIESDVCESSSGGNIVSTEHLLDAIHKGARRDGRVLVRHWSSLDSMVAGCDGEAHRDPNVVEYKPGEFSQSDSTPPLVVTLLLVDDSMNKGHLLSRRWVFSGDCLVLPLSMSFEANTITDEAVNNVTDKDKDVSYSAKEPRTAAVITAANPFAALDVTSGTVLCWGLVFKAHSSSPTMPLSSLSIPNPLLSTKRGICKEFFRCSSRSSKVFIYKCEFISLERNQSRSAIACTKNSQLLCIQSNFQGWNIGLFLDGKAVVFADSCSVHGNIGDGVYSSGGSVLYSIHCDITGNLRSGIRATSNSEISVMCSNLSRNSRCGIEGFSSDIHLNRSKFERNGAGGVLLDGSKATMRTCHVAFNRLANITVSRFSNLYVVECVVRHSRVSGIYVAGEGSFCKALRCRVHSNRLRNFESADGQSLVTVACETIA